MNETATENKQGLSGVKRIIVVISGKGGVGKSTVASQLAIGLWKKNLKVGLLDVDLCGPSIPKIMGLADAQVHQCPEGWVPVYADGDSQKLAVMSIGFLLSNQDDAVIWRGPKKSSMIGKMLSDVRWGDLDVLLIDTPPGTSDEHLTLVEKLKREQSDKLKGAIIVTTPQIVSLSDVRREIGFCRTVNIPIIGLIENMSGYLCPNCKHCSNVFSSGGGEALAKEKSVNFLGRLPVEPSIIASSNSSETFFQIYSEKLSEQLSELVNTVITSSEIDL